MGLRTLLAEDPRIQVIGEAATPDEIEERQTEIDVVIWSPGSSMNLETRSIDSENFGFGETTALLLIDDDSKILPTLARRKTHAWGMLSPESSGEEILAAIEAVYEGLVVTNPIWLDQLAGVRAWNPDQVNDMVETLTGRELEILQLLAQGLTNKQIALKLGISSHTVKFHVSSIFGKMGTTNRVEAVKLGLKKGLILL